MRSLAKQALAALLTAVITLAASAADGPPLLRLQEAVDLALAHNRSLAGARLEVDKAQSQTAAAKTLRRPQLRLYGLGTLLLSDLEFTFDRGIFGNFDAIGPVPPTDTSITTPSGDFIGATVVHIAQPLTQLHRVGLGVEASRIGEQIGAEQMRLEEQTVVHEVRRAYYSLLMVEGGLEAARESVAFHEELERVVGEHVRGGTALPADGLAVAARRARAAHDVLVLTHRRDGLAEEMNRLLGRDLATPFQLEAPPAPAVDDLEIASTRRLALAQRPEIRSTDLRIEQAEVDIRRARAEYRPDLSLTVDYFSAFNVEILPRDVVAAGLLLSWEPFDWGRRKREVAIKESTLEQARLRRAETEARIAQEAAAKHRAVEEARSLLEVSRLRREVSEEQRRVALDLYEQQRSLLRDVLQAEAELASAENEYQSARLSVWLAQADLGRALGEEVR